MNPAPRQVSRLAAFGVGAVLLLLAGFALWAGITTQQAADQSKRAAQYSNAYQQAWYSATAEGALHHQYFVERDSGSRRKLLDTVVSLTTSLVALTSEGQPQDEALAQTALADQGSYASFLKRVIDDIDTYNDQADAASVEANNVNPLLSRIEQTTARAAAQESVRSVVTQRSVDDTDSMVRTLAVVAFIVGLLALALFFWMFRSSRQREDGERLAIQESEARYRAITENASDAIIAINEEGVIISSSQAVEKLFGYTSEELLGQSLTMLMPENLRDTHREAMQRYLETGERHLAWERAEFQGMRKGGAEVPVEISLSEFTQDGKRLFTGIVRDITDRKRIEEALVQQALRDNLTELPNRALLRDRLQQAILAAHRDDTSVALFVLDLNRFKDVNESCGPQCGDALLRQVGQRLQRTVREADTVARLGEDEFAVLLPATDNIGATLIARKIASTMEPVFKVEGLAFDVSASIGIALYPEHADDATTLMRRADVAMHTAKCAEKPYVIYAPEQEDSNPEDAVLMHELRAAMETGQLALYYQPEVELHQNRAVHMEALLRWQHPERGFVSPASFISVAEETGLIKPLTRWVLNEALQQCATWQQTGLEVCVAVNLTARNLYDPEIVDTIAELAEEWNVSPHGLKVEITESTIFVDPHRAAKTLAALHKMGVGISIDDFGTGYSSLAQLKKLAIDEIKIDRSFVMDMTVNSDNAFIVRSIVDLGHNLGLPVVAEGVQNQATLEAISKMGCDLAQGYYLSPPLPAERFEQWLNKLAQKARTA